MKNTVELDAGDRLFISCKNGGRIEGEIITREPPKNVPLRSLSLLVRVISIMEEGPDTVGVLPGTFLGVHTHLDDPRPLMWAVQPALQQPQSTVSTSLAGPASD